MKQILLIGLLFIFVVVIACESGTQTINIPLEKKCMQDSDCTAATCCHAKESVNKLYAPDCKSAMCTMSCEAGTLDCGQGKVKCVEKECQVVISG
ncbi:MAG: hypothetical protein A3D39_00100 [Candidatus Buchananbacteria bacterium RIFCSPHIGHO2_02_FULL_39_17]|uniref:Uncharacterized protein n=1 Tax=Candidatus Buchananbacteria bacterium RIFCSPLOWO2_01_FULL_40_23b TaxID=1797544 RepID=A0A1G1YVJ4_9BACT|nr:MAG: hypothetical protein A3D39_00100 [Candidatus Buchananbacteria bacterium RIFCSPHIGHO2_02_FULL_39_17]OGY55786.1 MAG: hypothetical protein A2912_01010 [Candidatus Buchananbacteria bacterium RIFCSPLOWO2_01_FULL_40_23b]